MALLRRADPGEVAGRDLVGIVGEHAELGAAALPRPLARRYAGQSAGQLIPLQGGPFSGRALGPEISSGTGDEWPIVPWQLVDPPGTVLRARNFRRDLDLLWRRRRSPR